MARPLAAERQRQRALERANEVRLRRAALKRDVGGRETRPASAVRAIEILREREPSVRSLRLGEFLLWVAGVGEDAARRACVRLQISETKPLGALTERQVGTVEDWLRARGHVA